MPRTSLSLFNSAGVHRVIPFFVFLLGLPSVEHHSRSVEMGPSGVAKRHSVLQWVSSSEQELAAVDGDFLFPLLSSPPSPYLHPHSTSLRPPTPHPILNL